MSSSSGAQQQIIRALSRWPGTLPAAQRALFEAFVAGTLPGIRGPFLTQHPAVHVLNMLETTFSFTRSRPADDIRVEFRHGAGKGVMVLCAMSDQPFILDTMRLFLRRVDADYWGGFNVAYHATRDAKGELVSMDESVGKEAIVLLEADGSNLTEPLETYAQLLAQNLRIARAAVRDFGAMARTVERYAERLQVRAEREPAHALGLRESADFLKWLLAENFVLMGVQTSEPLGTQVPEIGFVGNASGEWAPPHPPSRVQVRKSYQESPIHRAGRIDEILVSIDDAEEPLFIRGMFTYRAVNQPCRVVPVLRLVLAAILDTSDSEAGSFRYKGIANGFDSLPTEFLFTAQPQAISDTLELIFESEQQQEVGVTFLKTGPFTAFCLVALPKPQFSDGLRRNIENDIRETLRATYCDHGLLMGRYDTVLVHYFLTGVEFPNDQEMSALSDRIRALATPWQARLWRALADTHGETRADELAQLYARAFPDNLAQHTTPARAVQDIALLESLSATRQLAAALFVENGDELTLRLYQASDVYLSDILPVLDNFGLVVIDSYANTVTARGGEFYLDTFRILGASNLGPDKVLERAQLLTEAIEAVFSGEVVDDPKNRLVLLAGLSWREVEIIRAFVRYCRQLQIKVSLTRMRDLVLLRPHLSAQLVELFKTRFDPDFDGDRSAKVAELDTALRAAVRGIQAHDEDLLFTTLHQLVMGTVRTNFFRTDRPFSYHSFKVDASKISAIAGPRKPIYEIFVHNKDVEGVHIRFGKVARGGLRWSDRDDYRTEVMSLATTQQVKNVVIVPVGCKGGFMLKDASPDPIVRRREADHHYKTFIRGLLDLTDNVVNGKTVHPPRVICHDPDDPYLVVAADKGTAHLSDTANSVSIEYGFWLGDAFASGGSNGYDHKVVGITARGAWVLVERHFSEMGRNPYTQPFTCVGVGDMGGDVFGNGLIESDQTKLLAAFNHMHIFLDPDPDPAASFVERKRLFDAGRNGGWGNYDTALISKGGGVFDRSVKAIPLSAEAQAMLGLQMDEAPPELVMQTILKMDVDLLWNGGIGTYVKASTETHANADDRSNDAIRVDATELRVKVIGEGGNLGMTTRARIEAGLRGIRLNTDFIDNSAGVDLSDHEVNLKILLDRIVERGDLTVTERNQVLQSMTDEVAKLVLADNDAQGRQISRDQQRSLDNIFQFGRTIDFLCKVFGVHRKDLHLPGRLELQERSDRGEGLTRPELAVLSSYTKMFVFQELLKDKPKTLPGYNELLHAYFPKHVRDTWPKDIDNHMLADEIAMTVATTRLVGDAGVTFFTQAIETTGRSVAQIAAAYLKAQQLAQTDALRATLDQLRSTVPLVTLYQCWVQVDAGARQVAARWLSPRGRTPKDDAILEMLPAVDQVYRLQASNIAAEDRTRLAQMTSQALPEAIAVSVQKASYLDTALLIFDESKKDEGTIEQHVVRHLAVAQASRLQEVLADLAQRPAAGFWEPVALQILHARFTLLLKQLVTRMPLPATGQQVDALVPELERDTLGAVRAMMDEFLESEPHPALSTLLVLEERLAGTIKQLGA